jgi:hypothetical protein
LRFQPAEFPPGAADSSRVKSKSSAPKKAAQVEQHSSDDVRAEKIFHGYPIFGVARLV